MSGTNTATQHFTCFLYLGFFMSLPQGDYSVWSVGHCVWSFGGHVWIFRDDGTEPFQWSSEDDLTVLRGGEAMTDVIMWQQGIPEIDNFGSNDISIVFFNDVEQEDEIVSNDPRFSIGDERLDEIITLENFVDNGDGTGGITVRIDPSDITATELMTQRELYIALRVNQPN